MISLSWPGPIPDLEDFPIIRVTVTTPRNQSALHRHLARLGYVPEVVAEGPSDVYLFRHPDGEK